jgi:hypothetical protein
MAGRRPPPSARRPHTVGIAGVPHAIALGMEIIGGCPRTVRKWVKRFQLEGRAGLQDRSSRPHRLRRPTPAGRAIMVRRVVEGGQTPEASRAFLCTSILQFCDKKMVPSSFQGGEHAYGESVLREIGNLDPVIGRAMSAAEAIERRVVKLRQFPFAKPETAPARALIDQLKSNPRAIIFDSLPSRKEPSREGRNAARPANRKP